MCVCVLCLYVCVDVGVGYSRYQEPIQLSLAPSAASLIYYAYVTLSSVGLVVGNERKMPAHDCDLANCRTSANHCILPYSRYCPKKNTIEPSPKGKSELVEAFDER